MEKVQARSRLKPKKTANFVKKTTDFSWLKKYWHYIFCLFIAIFAYFLLYLLTNKIYPTRVQNFLFANSYLPFFSLLFVADFFLVTFLTLNKKIGFVAACIINFGLYFQVNQITFDFIAVLALLLINLITILLAFPPRLFYNKQVIK